ncbi:MBL fold metallo-hydrolase [Micromonospora yasonensis]|uniref:MBL fold metallo-hydrolase n=1 Tax=Micromonospora yasonensis TaxID=1128667 RepID=UPI00222E2DE5|nr:MBL fold metallo-hydrolase [Micromonospora yasonensis]MCW3842984.1 MBL fold metallo-hydrolase [Micromonospora yasonensis]
MTENPAEIGRRAFLLAATAVTVAGATGVAAPAHAAPARRKGRSTMTARSVGGYEVIPLLDAAGPFFLDRQVAFPAATPRDWELARAVDPGAFGPGQTWQLDFRCYAIRGPRDRLMLVDTGVGPDGSPAGGWAPTPGRLPDELAWVGIDPADVDTVVLTHLHEDHFGWSVGLDGTPVFPNARYVVQQREVAALPAGDAARSYVVDPLRAAGQLDEVDGVTRLAAAPRAGGSVRVVPTPGHTPGHQSVVLDDGHDQVVVTGDVLVHAVQLIDPAVAYRYEADPDLARRTRERLLAEARARGAVLATAHLTEPWTELR